MQIPIIPHRGQKRPWTSIPRINWHHPLTSGLIYYGYDTGTGLVLDLVEGKQPTYQALTLPLNRPSARGSGLVYTQGGAGGFFPIEARVNSIFLNGLYSMACAWFITALPTSTFAAPFGINDAAGNNASTFLWNSAGTTDMQWAIANVNPATFTANSINTYHSLLGVNTSATSQNIYFDGALKTTTALTATFATTTCAPCFNTSQAGGSPVNGVSGWVYYGALWNRKISQGSARLLHDDPYCFLIYPEDEMFASLVGVTAATTSEDEWHQPWSSVGRRVAIIAAG